MRSSALAPLLCLALLSPALRGQRVAPAPAPVAASPAGTLVVLNKSAATADFVDTRTGDVVRTLATGTGPHEGVVSPDGRLAIVANYGGQEPGNTLAVFDLARGEALADIDLGEYTRPHGLCFAGDLLLVTCEGKESLVGVDLKTRAIVKRCATGQRVSHMVAASAPAKRAFVANIGSGSMTVIDLATWEVVKSIPTGAGAEGIDVSPDGAEVWVTNRSADTVTVLDAHTLEPKAELAAPGFPIRVKFTPDGARALVSCPNANEVAVFDARTHALVKRVPLTFELAEGGDEGLFGGQFGESAVPIGILIPPHNREAYVACAAANRVAVLDLATLEITRTFSVGREPDGLAWYPAP